MSLRIPEIGAVNFLLPHPQLSLPAHEFDGEHYWEINKRGYTLDKLIKDFNVMRCQLVKSYRVFWNPYHRFFVYLKTN